MRNIRQSPVSWRRSRILIGVALAAVTAIGLTACSGAGGSTSPSTSGGPDVGTGAVVGYEKVPAPGPAIDVSPLKGKTVYWIPITTQAPIFNVELKAATQAFEAAGVTLQLCDGKASPDAVAACASQAVNAGAAGIIATSIPPEFAQQAFAAAAKAGLALEFVNTKDATVPAEWGKKVAALPSNFVVQEKANVDLILKDAGSDAHVLLVGVTDSSVTTAAYQEGMQDYLAQKCPKCTISNIQVGTTTLSNLSSQVGAALTKDPSISYVQVEFDSFASPVVQALRQLNRSSSVKLLTALGQVDGLQRLANGTQFADTGYSISALGWNEADVMLRLLLGTDPQVDGHRTPIRTLTKGNITGLDISEAGWLSGAWTSSDDFRAMYRTLWGLS